MVYKESHILYWVLRVLSYTTLTCGVLGFTIAFLDPVISRLLGLIAIVLGVGISILLFTLSSILYSIDEVLSNYKNTTEDKTEHP